MTRSDRPIIVCGVPRSGTTALSLMLNQHAEIGLAREIELYKLPSIIPLLEETAVHHGKAWTAERRDEVVKAIWYYVGRPVGERVTARRWGMKTPWSEFNRDLWDPLVKPLWIYVIRRGDRVFQSNMRLGYGDADEPECMITRYKESIRIGEAMAREGAGHICQMDRADDFESRLRLAEGVFEFIEEEIDAGVRAFVEKWPTQHPATNPTNEGGPAGSVELPERWQELLETDSEYQEMMLAHGY
jgi:sulfotransferase family protein